jgi:hypothetical protein
MSKTLLFTTITSVLVAGLVVLASDKYRFQNAVRQTLQIENKLQNLSQLSNLVHLKDNSKGLDYSADFDYRHKEKLKFVVLSFKVSKDVTLSVKCTNIGKKTQYMFMNTYHRFQYRDYVGEYRLDVPKSCYGEGMFRIDIYSPESGLAISDVHIDLVDEVENYMVTNDHSLEGYLNKPSYFPGETVNIFAHVPGNKFDLTITDLAEKADRLLLEKKGLPGSKQHFNKYAAIDGTKWKKTAEFKIPTDWTSGIYNIQLSDKMSKYNIPLVIKCKTNCSDILVLANTNTWQAYNPWGMASFYEYKIKDKLKKKISNIISFKRPNRVSDPFKGKHHLLKGELKLIRWFKEKNIRFDMITDDDLHSDAEVLKNTRFFVLNRHPEYWSANMLNATNLFLKRGGSLLNLGGNTAFYRAEKTGDQLESRKDLSFHSHLGREGGSWDSLNRRPAAWLGVGYTRQGFNTYAPYKITTNTHRFFRGLSIEQGTVFGKGDSTHKGASGHETDEATPYSPPNLVTLAKGENPKGGGGWIVYYDHPGGGFVFSVGSIVFSDCLSRDPVCDGLVENALAKEAN